MKILVTGATGFLGSRAAILLAEDGHEITAVGRNLSKAPKHASIRFIQTDLTQELPEDLFKDIEAIVHCAALSSPWGRYEEFYRMNVFATEQLIEHSLKHQIKRFVYISSPSIYFEFKDKESIKECDPLPSKRVNFYAETKYLAELKIFKAYEKGLPAIILRPRAIFGPKDTALLPRVIKANNTKFIPKMREDDGPLCDLTYVDNVVHAIKLALISKDTCIGQAYNITNAEPVYLLETIQNLTKELGLKYNAKKIPYGLAFAYAAALELIYRFVLKGKEPAFTKYSISLFYNNQTLDITKAEKELGYVPPIDMKEGFSKTVRGWNSEQN
ncbi:MAG: NAD-dependent epimerase/dehydratase family protein [Campylobacteraceae bacterium]|jgi:nucleoside-diphosphate-sugar epimerase|nr:NAD-dependent epimerase/dehydratase family protein [Campylobacteraceae bacterium]